MDSYGCARADPSIKLPRGIDRHPDAATGSWIAWDEAESVNEIVPAQMDTIGHWRVVIPMRVMHSFLPPDAEHSAGCSLTRLPRTDATLNDQLVALIRSKQLIAFIDHHPLWAAAEISIPCGPALRDPGQDQRQHHNRNFGFCHMHLSSIAIRITLKMAPAAKVTLSVQIDRSLPIESERAYKVDG